MLRIFIRFCWLSLWLYPMWFSFVDHILAAPSNDEQEHVHIKVHMPEVIRKHTHLHNVYKHHHHHPHMAVPLQQLHHHYPNLPPYLYAHQQSHYYPAHYALAHTLPKKLSSSIPPALAGGATGAAAAAAGGMSHEFELGYTTADGAMLTEGGIGSMGLASNMDNTGKVDGVMSTIKMALNEPTQQKQHHGVPALFDNTLYNDHQSSNRHNIGKKIPTTSNQQLLHQIFTPQLMAAITGGSGDSLTDKMPVPQPPLPLTGFSLEHSFENTLDHNPMEFDEFAELVDSNNHHDMFHHIGKPHKRKKYFAQRHKPNLGTNYANYYKNHHHHHHHDHQQPHASAYYSGTDTSGSDSGGTDGDMLQHNSAAYSFEYGNDHDTDDDDDVRSQASNGRYNLSDDSQDFSDESLEQQQDNVMAFSGGNKKKHQKIETVDSFLDSVLTPMPATAQGIHTTSSSSSSFPPLYANAYDAYMAHQQPMTNDILQAQMSPQQQYNQPNSYIQQFIKQPMQPMPTPTTMSAASGFGASSHTAPAMRQRQRQHQRQRQRTKQRKRQTTRRKRKNRIKKRNHIY